VVQDIDGDLSLGEQPQIPVPTEQQRLNKKWLGYNQLENPNEELQPDQAARLNLRAPTQPVADLVLPVPGAARGEGQAVGGLAGRGGQQDWGVVPGPQAGTNMPAQPYLRQRPAQPEAAGVRLHVQADDAVTLPEGRESLRGEDAVATGGDVRDRARRYQEKLQLKAEAEDLREQFAQLQEDKSKLEEQLAGERAARRQTVAAVESRARELSQQLAELETRNAELAKLQRQTISGAPFSPNGKRIAAGSADGRVATWSAAGKPDRAGGKTVTRGTTITTVTDGTTRLPAGYASLKVDLKFDGHEYVFTSPRQGDVTARSVRQSTLIRIRQIAEVLLALLVLLAAYRLVRYIGTDWLTGRLAVSVLFVGGLLSLLCGILPLGGLLAILAAIVLFIRWAFRRRTRTAAAT
jgi:hypothetical protein